MKKIIVTTLATSCVALGVFAQGSVTQVQNMFQTDGITTPGANASNPALADGSLYYSGGVNVELFYAASGSLTQTQINAINALDGTAGGGAAALALLMSDNFTLVSATTTAGSTAGSLAYTASGGALSTGPNTIGLLSPVPTGGSGWLAMYAVGSGGTYNGYSGVIAWSQSSLGGNPTTTPTPGIPSNIHQDPAGLNLVLTTVPEPGTMALAGLGGLSLLLFRRKK